MPFMFEIFFFFTQGACRVELKLGLKLKKYTVTSYNVGTIYEQCFRYEFHIDLNNCNIFP